MKCNQHLTECKTEADNYRYSCYYFDKGECLKEQKRKPTGRIVKGMREFKVKPFGSDKWVTVLEVDKKQGIYMTLPQYNKHLKE